MNKSLAGIGKLASQQKKIPVNIGGLGHRSFPGCKRTHPK
jgi:hypothetical protein